MGLFTKKLTPQEQYDMLREELRQQAKNLRREIMGIEREEFKIKFELKRLAARSDKETAVELAKGLVRSGKVKARLTQNIANLQGLESSMRQALATSKVQGILKDVTPVMQVAHEALSAPEMRSVVAGFSKEVKKFDMLSDLQDAAMDAALNQDDISDAAENEINAVLQEVAGKLVGKAEVGSKVLRREQAQTINDEVDKMLANVQ